MLAKIPNTQTSDRNVNQLQSYILQTVNTLNQNPILNGIVLDPVTLSSGANSINHLLGRKLIGWIVVLRNNADTIYDTQSTNATPSITLNLVSSGTVTVTLYVF